MSDNIIMLLQTQYIYLSIYSTVFKQYTGTIFIKFYWNFIRILKHEMKTLLKNVKNTIKFKSGYEKKTEEKNKNSQRGQNRS